MLNGGDYQEAKKQLGYALHLIQDFYSHSNWVEQFAENGNINVDLGKVTGQMKFAGIEDTTCHETVHMP